MAKKTQINEKYNRGFFATLFNSKALQIRSDNQTIQQNTESTSLTKAKIEQGIITSAEQYLQNEDNRLIFEVKNMAHLSTILEVLDDLSDRYNIQHGLPNLPSDVSDSIIVISLKQVEIF